MKITNVVNTRVLPIDFDYYKPKTVNEAIQLLTQIPDSVILAGGLDLLIWIKMGQLKPRALINTKEIKELNQVSVINNEIEIGASIRIIDLERSEIIRKKVPLLWEVAKEFSSIPVRTMTTIGGNISSASPASDIATALLSLDTELEIMGPNGIRKVRIGDFYLGLRKTVLAKGEILTKISIKEKSENEGFGYKRVARIYDDIAKVIVATMIKLDSKGYAEKVAVSLGSVAPKVVRSPSVENYLLNKKLNEELIKEASYKVVDDISPIDDIRSTADWRRKVSPVLVKRALIEALKGVYLA